MAQELIKAGKYDVEAAKTATAAWRQELGDLGIAPEFPKAKIPAGGGTSFDDPFSADPENPDSIKEIRGVIVGKRRTSKLYLTSFEQRDPDESGRPDAWSIDGVTQVVPDATYAKIDAINADRQSKAIAPLPKPSRSLVNCPYSQFGSAGLLGGRGKGKATNDYIELYIFTGTGFPVLLPVPAGSITNVIKHLQNLVQTTGAVAGGETVVGLRKKKSGQGIDFSEAVFSIGGTLDADAVAQAKGYELELAPVLQIDPFGDSPVVDEGPAYDVEVPQAEDAGVAAARAAFAEPVGAGSAGDIDL